MTQAILTIIALLIATAFCAFVARRSRSTIRGVTWGSVSGAAIAYLFLDALTSLNYVLPFGQIDYWLAYQIHRVTG